ENRTRRDDSRLTMKSQLIAIVAAVLVVGCGNPDRALFQAVKDINIEAAKQAIADGADVNAIDAISKTPLDYAISRSHPEIADLLRKHGGKTGEELKAEGK
ncbi:MAG: ankyrin repeat domain-containing protein, partial [Verrucomicrobiota bacterium]|nr:ankyrin repeat domain-containing protein [Verrucomicrobiota bacterium]